MSKDILGWFTKREVVIAQSHIGLFHLILWKKLKNLRKSTIFNLPIVKITNVDLINKRGKHARSGTCKERKRRNSEPAERHVISIIPQKNYRVTDQKEENATKLLSCKRKRTIMQTQVCYHANLLATRCARMIVTP